MTKITRNIIIAILIIFIIGIAIYFLIFSKKQEVPIISSPVLTLTPSLSPSPTLILTPIVKTPLTQEGFPVDYDVTQSDANFLVSAVDHNSLVLKYITPQIKAGQQITSRISCLPQDIKMIYEPMNLSSEQNKQLIEEIEQLMKQTSQENIKHLSFEESIELLEQQEDAILLKYGYRIEYPNNLNDFFNRVQSALDQFKTITLIGKCSDNSCSEINQNCKISIK
jgi:hypothetical protein